MNVHQKTKRVITRVRKSPMTLFVIAGVLLGVAFMHATLWWVGLFAVLLCLQAVLSSRTVTQVLFGTLLMGFFHFGFVLGWLWNTHPIDGFGLSATFSFLVVAISWVPGVLALTLGKLLLTLPLFFVKDRKYAPLLFPVLWTVSDVVGAFFFTIVTFGPGSTWNANFSFGWVGYLLAEHGLLLRLAEFGGVFVLTVAYVSAGLVLWYMFQKVRTYRLAKVVLITFLFVGIGFAFTATRQHDELVTVAALETSLPSIRGVDEESLPVYRKELMQQVARAVASGNEYIILPEGSNMTSFFVDEEAVLAYLTATAPGDLVLVDSGWHFNTESTSYVRAKIYDTKTQSVYEMDKTYLVPQGEYMPYWFTGLLHLTGFGDAAASYQDMFDYVPGVLSDNASVPEHIPGVLFCSEAVSPFGARQAASHRNVPFVAHPVSHAWFDEPVTLWHQLDQMLRVNARFAGVSVYQAANMYEAKRY